MFGKLKIYIKYFSVGLLPAFGWLEGSMSSAEFIAENSYTPDIHHLIVLVTHHDLRRNIVESSTESGSFITKLNNIVRFSCINRPSEISKLDHIIYEDDILRL